MDRIFLTVADLLRCHFVFPFFIAIPLCPCFHNISRIVSPPLHALAVVTFLAVLFDSDVTQQDYILWCLMLVGLVPACTVNYYRVLDPICTPIDAAPVA